MWKFESLDCCSVSEWLSVQSRTHYCSMQCQLFVFSPPFELCLLCSCVICRSVSSLIFSMVSEVFLMQCCCGLVSLMHLFHVHLLLHSVSCPSRLWTPGVPISHLHVFPRRVNLSISLSFLRLPPDLIVVKFVPPAVFLTSKLREMKVPLANLGARELSLFFFSYS